MQQLGVPWAPHRVSQCDQTCWVCYAAFQVTMGTMSWHLSHGMCTPPSPPKCQRQGWMFYELPAVGCPFMPGKHLKPSFWQLTLQLHRAKSYLGLTNPCTEEHALTYRCDFFADWSLCSSTGTSATGSLMEVSVLIRKLQRPCPLYHISLPVTALSPAVELQVNAWGEGRICYQHF